MAGSITITNNKATIAGVPNPSGQAAVQGLGPASGGSLTLTGSATIKPVGKSSYVATVEGMQDNQAQSSGPVVVQWDDIQGKPTFGTAASRDVPAVGNASINQVVKGNDTRLTDGRPTTVAGIVDAQTTGKNVLLAPGQGDARTALGITPLGDAVVTANTPAELRTYAALGTMATQDASNVGISGGSLVDVQLTNALIFNAKINSLSQDLALVDGGTGASTAAAARTNLGSTAIGDAVYVAATPQAAQAAIQTYDRNVNTTFRNRLHNGLLFVQQVATGTLTAAGYVCDRWKFSISSLSASGVANTGFGFVNAHNGQPYLYGESTAANAIAASSYLIFEQSIEGINVLDLAWGTAAAKTITLSFWALFSITGTFCASFINAGGTRSYAAPIVITTAGTWQRVTITVPGDTSGTWLKDNGVGLTLRIASSCGTTYRTGTPNTWLAGNFAGLTGMTQLAATNGAYFHLSELQLEEGSIATAFERRDYIVELMMCQRYFWPMSNVVNTQSYRQIQLPVQMRAIPTFTLTSGTLGGANFTVPAPQIAYIPDSVPAAGAFGYSGNFDARI